MEYKYWLFERSAVQAIANIAKLQSCEFEEGNSFIQLLLQKDQEENVFDGVHYFKADHGLIFCGRDCIKTFLLIDLEQTKLNTLNCEDLLAILQKLFRFSIRYWNKFAFPQSEKILHKSNKAVVFPFSYSQRSNYRVVLEREPKDERMEKRDVTMCLLAYKYGVDGTPEHEEHPQTNIYRIGGQEYLDNRARIISSFQQEEANDNTEKSDQSVNVVEVDGMIRDYAFKFLPYEKQLSSLSKSQRDIVEYADITSPIKVQGPAGTGKTASLVLRAINLLRKAKEEKKSWRVVFFTHSCTTENQVRSMVIHSGGGEWIDNENNKQTLLITTLQEYCAKYVNFTDNDILDRDATEAKNLQLYFIQEAYKDIFAEAFSTYKYCMTDKCREFFETGSTENIVNMLQHEFSVRIKGMASGSLDAYQKTLPIENGIPAENEDDKGFVYRVFKTYQNSLETQSVYDTDDVVIEALARLNAPLWRRERVKQGFDYIFVDEMHLFNLNEQHAFHFLTKNEEQTSIPICFALDYSQAIGDRGSENREAIEKVGYTQTYGVVFRNSRQIAELCASITASGATLFRTFIDPYSYWNTGFTAKEEDKCEVPKLYMFENDRKMLEGVTDEIHSIVSSYKAPLDEIAVVFFDKTLLEEGKKLIEKEYKCDFIDGRFGELAEPRENEIVVTYPEYLNGLEFAGIVLVGVDEGRVPYTGDNDISQNFIRFNALNKLYLSCSRAKYRVTILGTSERGVSSCLNYSLKKKTLEKIIR